MKIAVITGASSGMGREAMFQIADRFGGLEEIWAIARREERLEEMRRQLPVPLRVLPLDLADPASWKVLEQELKTRKPQVRLLVNAAGYGKIGRSCEISLAGETGMIRLNCEALCAVTHMVLPYMPPHSRILQFASASAFLPQPGFAVYAATKAFVLSYSRALNTELKARNIIVTAVCPGPVDTEFFETAESEASMAAYKKLVMASPEKVVRTALRDSMMGKTVSVYGIVMKLFYLFSKILPHSILLKFFN